MDESLPVRSRTIWCNSPASCSWQPRQVYLPLRMANLSVSGGIQRQIDITDKQIDRLVYQLYGLTDSEIAIVEGRKKDIL